MDTLLSVVKLMRPNCFMATIDLKDAYYSVPVSEKHQKFLKFHWKGTYYKFSCFPNGLCFCPRKFTKLIKPIHSSLRLQGHLLAGYIDDNYNQGDTYQECLTTVLETVKLVTELGFCVHPEKSCLIPSQEIIFLGNVLNSVTMTITLTDEKKQKIVKACKALQRQQNHTIREVSKVIGLMVSSFSAVIYGPLYYRQLERDKSLAVKDHKGNYDAPMALSPVARIELQWWVDNIDKAFNVINHEPPSITINTDESKIGWGGVLDGTTCGGHWSPQESEEHINCLELRAALFSIQSLTPDRSNTHIRLKIDNTTAVAAINHMGTSHSIQCNNVALDIWQWCISKQIWVSAEHIPGKYNIVADKESREISTNNEWMLNPTLLHQALDKLQVNPDIDIVISKVLQKLEQDKATGVIVIPKWPTQVWYSMAMRMLISCPVLLQHSARLLLLPSHPQETHPLHKKLDLLVCHLSGDSCKQADFQQQLQTFSCVPGGMELKNNTKPTLHSGKTTTTPKGLVQFQ
ncbi:Transposon Tf2-6 poly, partial [Paramuricea clavata]